MLEDPLEEWITEVEDPVLKGGEDFLIGAGYVENVEVEDIDIENDIDDDCDIPQAQVIGVDDGSGDKIETGHEFDDFI
ncbi:hypothetical protein MRB53_013956 [Persea americana]|uniref:Uncharacterized protein n=1 Tax=Persea americana TaxID=3435 RepID=A0ACC2K9E4_PERAE|nr:hypothetical protein MRB53_013956 [Persea americana]